MVGWMINTQIRALGLSLSAFGHVDSHAHP